MGGYVDRFVGFQDENYKNAVDSLATLQTAVINIPILGSKPLEVALNYALQIKAGALSSSNPNFLNNWNNDRIGLINALVTTGGGPSYSVPQDIINQGPTEVFKETGLNPSVFFKSVSDMGCAFWIASKIIFCLSPRS